MKKTITLAVLLFAMILSSCTDDNNLDTQTTESTAPVSEVTTTAEVTAETTTGAGTEETTAQANVTESETEFDMNAEENLPYRLLNMTFGEIEDEFGPYDGFNFEELYDMGIVVIYEEDFSENTESTESVTPKDKALPKQIQIDLKFKENLYPGFNLHNGTSMTAEEAYKVFSSYTDLEWKVESDPLKDNSYGVHLYVGDTYYVGLTFQYSMDLFAEFHQEFMKVPEKEQNEWLDKHLQEFSRLLEKEKTGYLCRALIYFK